MGAFNEWTRGGFLEKPDNRTVATVARNILYGAAILTRAHFLRCQGVALPADALRIDPLTPDQLDRELMDN
jgi:hypothetical protein